MKKSIKKIGEILLDAGLIKDEELQNALTLQKGKNKKLGKVLIELGYINEDQVAETLSTQLSIPLTDCRDITVPHEVLSLIPREIAEQKIIFPLELNDRNLTVAMADPLDYSTANDIAFITGLSKISLAISPETSILDAIEKHYSSDTNVMEILKDIPAYDDVEFVKEAKKEEDQQITAQSLFKLSEAPPVVKLVTRVLLDATNSRASDVHVEPREKHVQVRYRVDGVLRNILQYPTRLHDSVTSRIKIISNLDITNRRLPQDGRTTLRLEKKDIDLRISTLPSYYGEKIVVRILDRTSGLISLSKLGISEHIFSPLLKLISKPQGMLLITGPTGSGKSTTLYSILQQLLTETENIITIEDPIEYRLEGLTQVGINDTVGLTFSEALRSILRQDPDIVMLGEIRDLATSEIAARSALTGHLVLSTLHTNDSISTITRLMDIGLAPYLVTSALSGILAQRLIRLICPECKQESAPPEEVKNFKFPPLSTYYTGSGCENCANTGYQKRIGVYEYLTLNAELKKLISQNADEEDIREAAKESGMTSLFEDAWSKVERGLTTVNEVISKVPFK
jgi:type IV pilus assembly protein PilB